MKLKQTLAIPALAIALATLPAAIGYADGQPAGPTAEDKIGWFTEEHIVDYAFVAEYAQLPLRDDVTVIDSRPERMYGPGHIPTAVLMPDSQFDDMAATILPEAKDQLLIFYCGGYACKLSHKSAYKAQALGHTNIKVYAAGFPDWAANGGAVAIDTQQVQAIMAGEEPYMLVDSRPKTSKYDKGYIPGAISLPDTQFEDMAGILPAAKDTTLVFYCGGFICKLSQKSAWKAMDLGYTNVFTYPAGFPAWKEEVGVVAMLVSPDTATAASMATPDLPDANAGIVPIEEFQTLLADLPDDVLLVDVRDPEEYEAGHIPASINIPVGELEDQVFDLPADKRVIYLCTSGGRSGEAYDLTMLLAPDVTAGFVDAVVKYNADGSVEITTH
jgi:rhodanese-related sulfurtransferase